MWIKVSCGMNSSSPISPNLSSVFGNIISSYTQADALEDGFLVDVSTSAQEAGICHPVLVTRGVWDAYVKVPPAVEEQDEQGRLWDIVWMLRNSLMQPHADSWTFIVYIRNDQTRPVPVFFMAKCDPRSINDSRPCITIFLPNED